MRANDRKIVIVSGEPMLTGLLAIVEPNFDGELLQSPQWLLWLGHGYALPHNATVALLPVSPPSCLLVYLELIKENSSKPKKDSHGYPSIC